MNIVEHVDVKTIDILTSVGQASGISDTRDPPRINEATSPASTTTTAVERNQGFTRTGIILAVQVDYYCK